jgi:MioC protein
MASHFSLIVGSVLGATEYVADALAEMLKAKGHTAEIFLTPNLSDIPTDTTWVVCSSTHGAGDLPENIQPFIKQLANAKLPDTNTYIIGLGDSSYDTFCFAAMTIEKQLLNAGVNLLAPPFCIDVLHHPIPEDEAVSWLSQQLDS